MAQITGGPHRGHAAGDNDAEKAASQLVSDIKYKVGLELEKKGGASHMNPAQVAQLYMQKLAASPAPGPVKAIAKQKLSGSKLKEEHNIGKLAQESVVNALNKVFVEGIEEPEVENEYLLQLEELEEKKYKIRVTDKKTGNTYVRMATRAKIAELRANPNISSVEMTSYGEPSETERTTGSRTAAAKAGKDYDGDRKVESPAKEHAGAVHNAIQRRKGKTPDGKDTSSVKEEFLGEVNGKKPKKKIGDEKVNNGKYVNLKPTLGGTMESVEATPKPSTLQKFQTQQKPNPAVEAKNKQVVQIQKKQLTDKMAQLNKGVPLTSSYHPEGELVDEKLATQYGNPNKLSQSSQRKSLGKGSSIKDGSKPSGYESPREFRDTEAKYQKNSFEPEGENVQEVAPPGMEGTVKAMKKHKEIDNPYALAWYMKNRGYKSRKKDMKEAASCDDEKTKINAEDPRSIPTKVNLLKNKLRAAGMKNPIVMVASEEIVSEEESDRIRDRQLELGGMGARASQSPAKTGPSKPYDPKKSAEASKKAMDLVRQSIIARHGKGALM
jgi:hypothetical protein